MASDAELADRIETLRQSRASRSASTTRNAGRRRHAAFKSRIAALLLSVSVTVGLSTSFFFREATAQTEAAFAALPEPVTPGRTTAVVVSPIDGTDSAPRGTTPSTTTASATAVRVDAFNGSSIDTRYGPVQVQVQVRAGSGELVDVAVLRFPDGDPTSRGINGPALPQLREEALVAQNAELDTISGATYTSRAYEASFQSALEAVHSSGGYEGAAP